MISKTYQINDLGLPPRYSTRSVTAINNSGQLIGYYSHEAATDHTDNEESKAGYFLWDAHEVREITGFSPNGMNDLGEIIGCCLENDKKRKTGHKKDKWLACLYKDQQLNRLPLLPNTLLSSPKSINRHGQIAGVIHQASPRRGTACTWIGDKLETLAMSDEFRSSEASAINDQGQIVGQQKRLSEAKLLSEAVLWNEGKVVRIGNPPGYLESVAKAINNSGQILVSGFDNISVSETINRRAFLWTQGQFQELAMLKPSKKAYVLANDLNDHGQVVGNSIGKPRTLYAHAYLWQSGSVFDLNTLIPKNSGWELISAQSINNHGQIACHGIYQNCMRAVLLTPETPNNH